MRAAETLADARRALEICNACRYCEGFCAVFPAMELRREFTPGDLHYLANLCHNCRGCYYACQYAPPHEFGLNLPRALAHLRGETYAQFAWPGALGRLFQRNGLFVSICAALGITLVFLLLMAFRPAGMFATPRMEPGAFYDLVPMAVMVGVSGAACLFSLLAMLIGLARFWRGTGSGRVPGPRAWGRALVDAATLRNLGGGGEGCNDRDERFSRSRRRFHHALFYGFMLCLASTTVASAYEHLLHLQAPYPFFSVPVLLGTVGGLGMLLGCGGLLWLKAVGDAAPAAPRTSGGDVALLALLGMTALTGLALLALRATPAMGSLLAIHLGVVLAFFLVMPYSKFVHGLYRGAALLRSAREQQESQAAGE